MAARSVPALATVDGGPSTVDAAPLRGWAINTDAYTSSKAAAFRLGGDATAGICALFKVQLPTLSSFSSGGAAAFTLDVGISIDQPVALDQVTLILRDCVVLVGAQLPAAIADILPLGPNVYSVEAHLMAAQTDGHHHNRPNSLSKRIDLSSLGAPTRYVGSSASYAFEVSDPLSDSDAAIVIVEALELAAYDHGFLRPDSGIVRLRQVVSLR